MALKGYWIARVTVNNQADYDEYRKRNALPLAKYGGKFIVRGGRTESVLGAPRPHNVVIEFPDYETALACYNSFQVRRSFRAPVAIRILPSAAYPGSRAAGVTRSGSPEAAQNTQRQDRQGQQGTAESAGRQIAGRRRRIKNRST